MKKNYLFIFILAISVFYDPDIFSQVSPGGYPFITSIGDSLLTPVRIAIDSSDHIYITDALEKKIKRYSPAGVYLNSITTGGYPLSIAISDAGQIMFGDGYNGRIYKIQPDGTRSEFFTGAVFPSSMVFGSDGLLYVSDSKLKHVIVVDMSGNLVRTIGEGTLTYPTGITFDKKNNRVLVAEHGGIGTGFSPAMKIRIYGLTGNLITSFGSYGSSDGKFYRVQGMAVGRCGEIYIPEPYQGSVSVFNENTTFTTRFAQYGDSLGQLRIPLDIAINSQDQIFITAENNGTIEVFSIDYLLPTSSITCGNKTICAGDSALIPIHFTGIPPWTFTYLVEGAFPVTISNTTTNPYLLAVSAPGNYQVSALSDSSHSGTCFSGNAIISIDSIIPTASMNTTALDFCSGQNVNIPVNFTGTPPWEFSYTNNGMNPKTVNNILNTPYLLNVTQGGNYNVTSISGKGCAGSSFTGITQVTEHPLPTASITSGGAAICAGDTAHPVIMLTGTPPWSITCTISGSNPTVINNIQNSMFRIDALESGDYGITQVSDAFCSGVFNPGTYTLAVDPFPTASISSGDAGICVGDSSGIIIDLTGHPPWSLAYSVDGITRETISGINESPYVLWVSQPGVYHVSAVSDATCTGISVTGMAIVSEYLLPGVDLGPPIQICEGDSLILDAGTGFSHYLWSDSTTNQTITVRSPGIYIVNVRDSNGCTASAVKIVTAEQIPSATFFNPSVQLCQGETSDLLVELTGTPPWSFTYTQNGSNSHTVSNVMNSPYLLNVAVPGIYQVIEVIDAVCKNRFPSGIATVAVYPLPTYNFSSGNGSICSGQPASLMVDLSGTPPWNLTYTLNGINPVILNLIGSNTVSIPVSLGGTYEIIRLSDAWCLNTAVMGSTTILTNPVPMVNLGPDVTISEGATLTLDAGSSFESYIWSDGTTAQTLNVSTSGLFHVTVTDYNGCTNNDSVTVMVSAIPVNRELMSLNVTGSECFNAKQTITVAGGGTTFEVQGGGSATMIAGHSILFFQGTTVYHGGYMHAYITADSTYCGVVTPAMAAVGGLEPTVPTFTSGNETAGSFKLYPNPSTGPITLEVTGEYKSSLTIDICDMAGRNVFSAVYPHLFKKKTINLTGFPSGFYMVRVTWGKLTKVVKLILID